MASTETVDPRFTDIDSWPAALAIEAMYDAQLNAAAAVRPQLAALAAAGDAAAGRLGSAGRLVFVGAGTSGRIAVQDGVELGPTFGWPADRIVTLLAGGVKAMTRSVEGAEDDGDAACEELRHHGIGAADVVIGVAASGRTPYTVAAVEAARMAGALTIGIANNAESRLIVAADHGIVLATGSEVIAGSTRMKAGTAQKIALNLLSTAIMLRLGRVYRGLMVDMMISNEKLLDRARRMVADLGEVADDRAATALDQAGGDIKRGVLIARGLTPAAAEECLARNGLVLRRAIEALER